MAIGGKPCRAICVGRPGVDDGNENLQDGSAQGERHECPRCEQHFDHARVLQLHLRAHDESPEHQEGTAEPQNSPRDQPPPVRGDDGLEFPSCQLPARKAVGLTKVRLEDCLRCDACSCIYLDQSDYDKHMRNFHRHDSPKKHRPKRGCRSCCRHCNCRGDHQHSSLQKERGNNNLFHYNIKDRWTKMVSRRLACDEVKQEVKPDPDEASCSPPPPLLLPLATVDFSHLLSQVEVKIKTEPLEDLEITVQ